MSALYIETSAVLSWLFGEDGAQPVIDCINNADRVATSTLTRLETERSLVRAEKSGLITAAARHKLLGLFRMVSSGWYFLSISEEVLTRSCLEFPAEPVRSLDAIHLASALETVQLFQDITVLSYDKRVLDNIVPLGLKSAL
jgi:predicted nucleic acid-binding protein